MQGDQIKPIQVFYCYAYKDKKLLKQLEEHLSPLKRADRIMVWSAREVQAGTDWAKEIEDHLNVVDIILLLVSPSFIASDLCYSVQMQKALERHKAGEAKVIPVLLRPTFLEETPLKILQALPRDNQPITQWRNRDTAFLDVVFDLWVMIKGMHEERSRILNEQRRLAERKRLDEQRRLEEQRMLEEQEKVLAEIEGLLSEAEMLDVRKWFAEAEMLGGRKWFAEQVRFLSVRNGGFVEVKALYEQIRLLYRLLRLSPIIPQPAQGQSSYPAISPVPAGRISVPSMRNRKSADTDTELLHRARARLRWGASNKQIVDIDLELLGKALKYTRGWFKRRNNKLLRSWATKLKLGDLVEE